MRSRQIRKILTTIAVAACCAVATAGVASTEQPSASSEARAETKKSTKGAGSETKNSTAVRKTKGGAKASAAAKTKKAAAPTAAATTKTENAAPAKSEKAAPAATAKATAPAKTAKAPHRVVGGGVGVLPQVAAPASTTPDVGIHGIKERARWAPAKVCADTNKKLQGTMRAIDKEASKSGDRLVMARIATEFGIPAEAILAERARLSAPWGELVVAHTLLASAPGVTVDQLFDMRDEGLGWGQIAHGLGLKQKEVASAVKAEGRVVRGQSKPDGTPAPIASVEPRVVVDETAHAGPPTTTPEVGAVNEGTPVTEPVKK